MECYIECEEHVYAYFSLRKILFSTVQGIYKKIHGFVRNLMIMHGYAYFLQEKIILSVEFRDYTRESLKWFEIWCIYEIV